MLQFARKGALCLLAASGAMFVMADAASAQIVASPDEIALARTGLFSRDQNLSVMDRPRPDYQPLGLDLDGLKIESELDTSIEYNNNIYAVPTNGTSDEIVHINPVFSATTDWARDQLQIYGHGTFNEYFDHSTEDVDNGALGATGRLDLSDNIGIAAGASYERDSLARTSPNSPAAATSPVQYGVASGFVVGAVEFTRLRLSGRFDFQNYHYDNGVAANGAPIFEGSLDYNIETGTFRAEYAASPGTSVFANLVVNHQDNLDIAPGGLSRTGSGYEATVGTNFDLTHLIRGEVFLGYLDQTFDNNAYKEISGVSLRGYVQWFPTQLVTVTISGTRLPVDSAIPGAGAYLDSNYSARIDYELLRNLIISGVFTYENDAYAGLNRTDNRNYETLTATYYMNRRVSLNLTFQHLQNSSTGTFSGLDFDIESMTAGFALHY